MGIKKKAGKWRREGVKSRVGKRKGGRDGDKEESRQVEERGREGVKERMGRREGGRREGRTDGRTEGSKGNDGVGPRWM